MHDTHYPWCIFLLFRHMVGRRLEIIQNRQQLQNDTFGGETNEIFLHLGLAFFVVFEVGLATLPAVQGILQFQIFFSFNQRITLVFFKSFVLKFFNGFVDLQPFELRMFFFIQLHVSVFVMGQEPYPFPDSRTLSSLSLFKIEHMDDRPDFHLEARLLLYLPGQRRFYVLAVFYRTAGKVIFASARFFMFRTF